MATSGRVCTGFSKPYVATYSVDASGNLEYSNVTELARGVDVSITPNTTDNKFYANNSVAEVDNIFTSGTFTLTVDGLETAAEKLIMGLPTADTQGWLAYDDDQEVPEVGLGFVARYMKDGVAVYVPYVLARVTFDQIPTATATSEDSLNFQTQSLSGQILRAGDAKHSWRFTGKEYDTEAAAVTAIQAKLA